MSMPSCCNCCSGKPTREPRRLRPSDVPRTAAAAAAPEPEPEPAPERRAGGAEDEPPKPSRAKMAREGYGELVNAIIRPPRMRYDPLELGPEQLRLGALRATRTDIELQSKRPAAASGLKEKKGVPPPEFTLRCSHWEPAASCRPSEKIPCVVYLHGNCGSRVEALDVLHLVLSLGMSLFSLDLGGAVRTHATHPYPTACFPGRSLTDCLCISRGCPTASSSPSATGRKKTSQPWWSTCAVYCFLLFVYCFSTSSFYCFSIVLCYFLYRFMLFLC